MKNITIKLFSLIMLTMAAPVAKANCIFTISNSRVFKATIPDIEVSANLPIGGVIATVTTNASGVKWMTCTGTNNSILYKMTGNWGSYADYVQNTNLAGVGVKMTVPLPPGTIFLPNSDKYYSTLNVPAGVYYDDYPSTLTFIKTGEITAGTVYNWSVSGSLRDQSTNGSGGAPGSAGINFFDFNIKIATCNVSSRNLSIQLGNVPADSFGDTPGALFGNVGQDTLNIACDKSQNVKLRLDGNESTDLPGAIDLDNKGAAGVADGVGIVFSNDTLGKLPLGTDMPFATAITNAALTIGAQYIQTKPNVKAGTANATATLTLTYE
ncbi:fimbrial protein [Enterobacter bugandensis]|uniref:fimbrial protein n=1 Tax=Enterobacter bugandensis TaxID=881260 RepID=UPI0023AFE08C|nr:fimbrial protein [Enterobacter bugandensis]MDE7590856.1 fimbrial protein [Enterobacter bugandensis]